MREIDISSEKLRQYTYRDGAIFTILEPVKLFVIEDERGLTHRVIDNSGMTHRPNPVRVGISWMPLDGEPAFVA